MKIALIGNPNCGKTTLFNALTGSRRHVGNFPGVTVEYKEAQIKNHPDMTLVDLPGMYSFVPYTAEEAVAKDYILTEKPNALICICDATCLSRSLYLAISAARLQIPMVIALSMTDELEKSENEINITELENALSVCAVKVCASENKGINELCEKLKDAKCPRPPKEETISDTYAFIDTLCERVYKKPFFLSKKQLCTLRADAVLTNKYLAFPIFILIMLLVFYITFGGVGGFLNGALSTLLEAICSYAQSFLSNINAPASLSSLVVFGFISGVGGVLSFMPTLLILFFLLSLLEDSGYMARVAFFSDNIFKKIGLSGRSPVPLLIGFGCSCPAILSCRTLANERERKMTICLVPFMSCGAKLPIYALFAEMFFKSHKASVMLSVYLFGVAAAIVTALIFKKTLFKGEASDFVMELPPYRLPTAKNIFLMMYERTSEFVKKVAKVILPASIIIWFLQSFDFKLRLADTPSVSMLCEIGKIAAVFFIPLGFGFYQAASAAIAGLFAKEAVVSTLLVLCGTISRTTFNPYAKSTFVAAQTSLSDLFTPAAAYSFMIFTLLYPPCIAALSAAKAELQEKHAAAKIFLFQTALAWVCSYIVFTLLAIPK